MGTPVVSTTIGAQGLGLVHDSDILLADDSEAFVAQTVRGLGDIELRKRLRVAGLETVCSRLSWKTLGHPLNSIYSKLFLHKPAPVPQPQPAMGL
jgi:glycosyltransferase involved in cell wall biosynthesis